MNSPLARFPPGPTFYDGFQSVWTLTRSYQNAAKVFFSILFTPCRPLTRIGQFHKAWLDTKTKHTTGKSKRKLVSGPIVRVIHRELSLKIVVFKMADTMNGQGLPVRHTEPYKISKMTALWWMTLKTGPLTNFVLFFSLVCFMFVFVQTLVEHLYCEKGLLQTTRLTVDTKIRTQSSTDGLSTHFRCDNKVQANSKLEKKV